MPLITIATVCVGRSLFGNYPYSYTFASASKRARGKKKFRPVIQFRAPRGDNTVFGGVFGVRMDRRCGRIVQLPRRLSPAVSP